MLVFHQFLLYNYFSLISILHIIPFQHAFAYERERSPANNTFQVSFANQFCMAGQTSTKMHTGTV